MLAVVCSVHQRAGPKTSGSAAEYARQLSSSPAPPVADAEMFIVRLKPLSQDSGLAQLFALAGWKADGPGRKGPRMECWVTGNSCSSDE